MNVYCTPHRGTIQRSFKERKAFPTVAEALACIVDDETTILGYPMFNLNDVYIRYRAFDSRIQCETFMVCLGRYGAEDYLKRHRCPQCHAWLHFGPEWQETIRSWRHNHKDSCYPASQFISHFDSSV